MLYPKKFKKTFDTEKLYDKILIKIGVEANEKSIKSSDFKYFINFRNVYSESKVRSSNIRYELFI